MTRWTEIARSTAGEDYARRYAERFRALAESGQDTHGEASFVTDLAPPPASVLDAGCGTGRIAIRLSQVGYDVTGVDVDPTMLAMAKQDAPGLHWVEADLADFDLGATYDVVLLAGNIIPLLEPATLEATARRLTAHVAAEGVVVCGFGLDAGHLPPGCPVTPMSEVEAAFDAAGLRERERFATWDRAPYDLAEGYVVTVHVPR